MGTDDTSLIAHRHWYRALRLSTGVRGTGLVVVRKVCRVSCDGCARTALTASGGRPASRDSAMLWRLDRSTTRTFKIFRSARVLGLHSSWTAAINYASTVHGPCCTGMGFNVNYEINAAADAVMIVYELTKRVGNPTRRVRARGPTPLAVWRLRRP